MFKEGNLNKNNENSHKKIELDKKVENFVLRSRFKEMRKSIADGLRELPKPTRKEAYKKIIDLLNIRDNNEEDYEKKVGAALFELKQVVGNKDFVADIDYALHSRNFLLEGLSNLREAADLEDFNEFMDDLERDRDAVLEESEKILEEMQDERLDL